MLLHSKIIRTIIIIILTEYCIIIIDYNLYLYIPVHLLLQDDGLRLLSPVSGQILTILFPMFSAQVLDRICVYVSPDHETLHTYYYSHTYD